MAFIETNQRNPSRHRIEDHFMLNWLKQNRKLLNAGKLKEDRVELLEIGERYKRVNQYKKYVTKVQLIFRNHVND